MLLVSMWLTFTFEHWSFIPRAEFDLLPLKVKSRLPACWSFISWDKDVIIHAICVNNMANPKMRLCFFYMMQNMNFFSSVLENWLLKVLTMPFKVKYQLLCFSFFSILVRKRWRLQVILRFLDMVLTATLVCGIRLRFSGECVSITAAFAYRNRFQLSSKWCAKEVSGVHYGFSVEKPHHLHKRILLLCEQLWWNGSSFFNY